MKNRLFLVIFFMLVFTGFTSISAQNNINSSPQIKELIAKKRAYNKKYGFGYRVQLYNGSEKTAKTYKERFKVEFPGVFSKLVYNAPDWKVHVGNYKTKLEADKGILLFKEKFSGIIVVPMGK